MPQIDIYFNCTLLLYTFIAITFYIKLLTETRTLISLRNYYLVVVDYVPLYSTYPFKIMSFLFIDNFIILKIFTTAFLEHLQ